MRLFLLTEAINPGQLEKAARAAGGTTAWLSSELADIDHFGYGQYLPWVLKQIINRYLDISDDKDRLLQAFRKFKEYKQFLETKDINQYGDITHLETALSEVEGQTSKRKGYHGKDFRKLPGIKVVAKEGHQTLVAVTDPESLAQLGLGTRWCTRADYEGAFFNPDEGVVGANWYLDKYQHIFLVFDGLVPQIQFTPSLSEVKDRNNVETDLPAWVVGYLLETGKIKLKGAFNRLGPEAGFDGGSIIERSPVLEKAILSEKDPEWMHYIVKYAQAIGQRWPEGEKALIDASKKASWGDMRTINNICAAAMRYDEYMDWPGSAEIFERLKKFYRGRPPEPEPEAPGDK